MYKISILCSFGLLIDSFLDGFSQLQTKNKYGEVTVLVKDDVVFLPRHGLNNDVPPHLVNYKANIYALKEMEVKKVIGVNSAGSLKKSIKPGSIVIPDDYVNFTNILTYYDSDCNSAVKFITPSLDNDLRLEIIKIAKELGIATINNGVYVQTRGPRLETKAEINVLKNWGDIVGMTMANEATLTKELNLPYACLCSIDNYANGIEEVPLTEDKIFENQAKNSKLISKLLKVIVERF